MAKKRNLTAFKDFESPRENCNYQVGYIRLVDIQLECMNELSNSAFRLYIMMKSYAKGNAEFTFPYRIQKNFISKQGFLNARDELITYGYLEQFVSNKNLRTENKYRFSSKWRDRNQDFITQIIESRKQNK